MEVQPPLEFEPTLELAHGCSRCITHDSACIIAAPLPLLKVGAHYAFQVRIPNGVVIPCQKIVTLIKSTKASKPVNIGHGYKLVTTDVEDFLASDIKELVAESNNKVTVTGKADGVFVVELVKARKCREVGRCPTGEPMGEPFNISG